MAIEFAIEDRRIGDDTHVVAVTGEIDLFTAPEFKQRMSQPIEDGVERLIVDLSGTTFIDSIEPRGADRRASPPQAAGRQPGGRLRQ